MLTVQVAARIVPVMVRAFLRMVPWLGLAAACACTVAPRVPYSGHWLAVGATDPSLAGSGTLLLGEDHKFFVTLTLLEGGLTAEEQRRVALERGFPLVMRGTWEVVEDGILMMADESQGKPAVEGVGLFATVHDGNLELVGPCVSLIFRRQ